MTLRHPEGTAEAEPSPQYTMLNAASSLSGSSVTICPTATVPPSASVAPPDTSENPRANGDGAAAPRIVRLMRRESHAPATFVAYST